MNKLIHAVLLGLLLNVVFISNTFSQKYKGQLKPEYIKTTLDSSYTKEYVAFKESLVRKLGNIQAGQFSELVEGVKIAFETNSNQIAFAFDACIGHDKDYNQALIDFLRKEKIPATFFISGSWIDSNLSVVHDLASDTLFELENHGLFHRICTIDGKTKYDIQPTKNVGEVIDEMEINARKIEKVTGRRPLFFRSATAYIDEASVKIAESLGMKVVNYDILSGDAIPGTPATILKNNIINKVHPGAIVIMHCNHPKWHEKEALETAIPILRSKGYTFVKLEKVKLIEKERN